jgi:HAD superfamily hydrolase (TIGR01509 family)
MPMPFPKAVLWDMDGVLADTSDLHFQTWERILAIHGVPFDRQKFHQIFGLKSYDFLPILIGKPLEVHWMKEIVDQKEDEFRQILPGNILPLPGVMDWLKRFKLWGCRQAIASSAEPKNVDVLVDELDIREYFDALVTPVDLPGKPDPAVFLKASDQLETPRENCIVIEDSLPGIEAALRAGMRCIAVTNTNPPEALAHADLVVESLAQLTIDQVKSLI